MSKRHNPQYELLMQNAIENIETLLDYWKIPWQRSGSSPEYDLLAVWRGDNRFGSCKFNIHKNKGDDFARDIILSPSEFKALGASFTREDYNIDRASFDIIGLCLRAYELDPRPDYHRAAKLLENDLKAIGADCNREELALRAQHRSAIEKTKANERYERACRLWKAGKDIKGTPGEIYLNVRGIFLNDDLDEFGIERSGLGSSIRFIEQSWDDEPRPNGTNRPTIVFKISDSPNGRLRAIQRIFLSDDHKSKAGIQDPKKTLVPDIKGNAIWFGEPDETLYVAEGPENALSMKYAFGGKFVISTVNIANMPDAPIPRHVKRVIVCVDPKKDDQGLRPGVAAGEKLASRAIARGLKAVVVTPPAVKSDENDWNDLAQIVSKSTNSATLTQNMRNYLNGIIEEHTQ